MAKDTIKLVRPSEVSEITGVDAKLIRSFLRKEFTRPNEAKNTSWHLTPAMVEAVIEHFSPDEDDAEELEVEDED